MALDRDLIVRTALRLLDDVGLEKLSLRRLAKELDAHATALYWHFASKQELLDAMGRAMVQEAVARGPLPETWQDWLAELARAQRKAVRSHRDGALLLLTARPTADYQVDYLDELVGRLMEAGFTAESAAAAFVTVSNYAVGAAFAEQQGGELGEEALDDLILRSGERPGVAGIVAAAQDLDAVFERGLAWLLAGMRAELG
ncbi:TetR/AcrR family transcriptional regulator C-terminal domain-containing protein [Nonomuraea sediminis]|uniref:TetR/AcrR family transcriptional regulator C-terminal domain-containing protein n=1 Tax=Nonomuraea sediminis TaxID=2835864 RepID=UPI001BDD030A|nr:TetR/AcrR family transcriptional regulator C-terminal domain-containing protein [Nonomuraea sediminis]